MNIIEAYKIFDTNKYEIIRSIIINIEKNDWNKAKELWIFKIMNYQIRSLDNDVSLFGSEDLIFLDYIAKYQENRSIQNCQLSCKKNKTILRSKSRYIYFQKVNDNPELCFGYADKCSSWGKTPDIEINFLRCPKP